jgi:hypothetical protein
LAHKNIRNRKKNLILNRHLKKNTKLNFQLLISVFVVVGELVEVLEVVVLVVDVGQVESNDLNFLLKKKINFRIKSTKKNLFSLYF